MSEAEIYEKYRWFCCNANADMKGCEPGCPRKRALAELRDGQEPAWSIKPPKGAASTYRVYRANADEPPKFIGYADKHGGALLCPKHRRYEAKRPPKALCEDCWRAWIKALDQAEAARLEARREWLRVDGNCKHPEGRLESFSWEHDNGYGRQTERTGKRCRDCGRLCHWHPHGSWILPEDVSSWL
jgi:hypothetical protein